MTVTGDELRRVEPGNADALRRVEPGNGDSLRRVETRFDAAGGRRLFRRAWLPASPRAAMVVVHGFGEHSGRYEGLARFFAHRGVAVHAYDQVGHGQSGGPRGHVDDFGWLHDDLDRFLAFVRDAHAGLPLVLLGHSMGGLVVASFVGSREHDADLVVTSGAALSVGRGVSGVKLALARLLRRIWPTLSLEAGLDLQGLSRDPDVISAYEADPLVHGTASAAFGASMTETAASVVGLAPRVARPMLLLHGEDDPLCEPEGSRRFFEALPGRDAQGHALRVYPGLRHEIFNEPEREQVYRDVLDWVEARLAEAGAQAPATPVAEEASA